MFYKKELCDFPEKIFLNETIFNNLSLAKKMVINTYLHNFFYVGFKHQDLNNQQLYLKLLFIPPYMEYIIFDMEFNCCHYKINVSLKNIKFDYNYYKIDLIPNQWHYSIPIQSSLEFNITITMKKIEYRNGNIKLYYNKNTVNEMFHKQKKEINNLKDEIYNLKQIIQSFKQ